MELGDREGMIAAKRVAREVLAKGAHERRMQRVAMTALPLIAEAAAKPLERVGEIRVLNIAGGQTSETGHQAGVGSMVASVTALPIVREILSFVNELVPRTRPDDHA